MVFGVESGVALKCRAYVRSGSGEGPGHHTEAPGLVPRAPEEPLGLKKRKCWHPFSSCAREGSTSVLSISCTPGPRSGSLLGAGQRWEPLLWSRPRAGAGQGRLEALLSFGC